MVAKLLSPQEVFSNSRTAVAALRREPVSARRKRLADLRRWILKNRAYIHDATYADLHKPSMETDATEIFHVLNEIKVASRSLERWASPQKIDAPIFLSGSRAWIQYEPRGVCLIISPWNYPFGLAAGPLVSALAAGNSAILKPSEMTPTVSALIKRMCHELFEPSVVSVCEGDKVVSQELLALPFDHIFFTGSPSVGKIVMRAAAEHLASVTLELGGKSPAIVTDTARLQDAAERIAVGKFLNNGQTCIAPDYLLIDKSIADSFISKLIERTRAFYAPDGNFETSSDYARIINDANFERIERLLDEAITDGAKLAWHGSRDKSSRYMHPIILTDVSADSRIMKEEIFGPVLPILTYEKISDVLALINALPKPLALYMFTADQSLSNRILEDTSSGTVCINDCGVQFLHHGLPFGGTNNSGIGKAHGHHGFLAFSNEKAVLKQKSGYSPVKAFYPPFTQRTKRLMDWFLKLF